MMVLAYLEREKRADQRAGILAALTANVNLKKGARPLRPQDFFPSLRPPRRPQTPEQQRLFLEAMTLALGGKVVRRSEEEEEDDGD